MGAREEQLSRAVVFREGQISKPFNCHVEVLGFNLKIPKGWLTAPYCHENPRKAFPLLRTVVCIATASNFTCPPTDLQHLFGDLFRVVGVVPPLAATGAVLRGANTTPPFLHLGSHTAIPLPKLSTLNHLTPTAAVSTDELKQRCQGCWLYSATPH